MDGSHQLRVSMDDDNNDQPKQLTQVNDMKDNQFYEDVKSRALTTMQKGT